MSCIFCQIISGEIPGEILHQDDEVIAFRDINPRAPIHILIVPRKHLAALSDLTEEELPILGKMAGIAKKLAEGEGISERGYRIVVNCGPEGGQLVPHLHMHLLGGRQLSDEMG
ncbi:MAG: histidine triad nucleotide-binding protein [Dehalococcoidia bacterium]|nr:Purine nucleoside phosphoramidase [Chloroflexota bacterium]MBT9160200.1 Purine nucleoside phosphoramidase [Chloroflexota bacterium]MBT9162472.1 Purine nucleoside phosphoramidase [Chloroflexota bacterium]